MSVSERVSQLLAEVEALVAASSGQLSATPRGSGQLELGPRGGEWVELSVDADVIRMDFAGWTEAYELDGEAESDDEACELALDFVAAAVFGELRVIEQRLQGQVLRRSLEVRVHEVWRRCARQGRYGLAGARAWLRRELERRVRSNEGRVRRPAALRDAGPSGLASAPWSGAGRSAASLDGAELAIDGELDLHNFSPKEVGALVREYIEVCHSRGVVDLRIVHGKGKGVLRRTVHALLAGHPLVEDFRLGGHGEGSWGATIVRLRKPPGA